MIIISESGLYSLILTSRTDVAKRVKKSATTEVLPSIRKTGACGLVDPIKVLNDPASMRGLLPRYFEKVIALDAAIAELAPKAESLDRIANADGSLKITEAAKALQIHPKDLFSYLQQHGLIDKRAGNANLLGYQKRVQAGDLYHGEVGHAAGHRDHQGCPYDGRPSHRHSGRPPARRSGLVCSIRQRVTRAGLLPPTPPATPPMDRKRGVGVWNMNPLADSFCGGFDPRNRSVGPAVRIRHTGQELAGMVSASPTNRIAREEGLNGAQATDVPNTWRSRCDDQGINDQTPGDRVPSRGVAVALVQALGAALAVGGAAEQLSLQLHQPLGGKSDHLAQQAGFRTLLEKLAQGHRVIGHRGVPRSRLPSQQPNHTEVHHDGRQQQRGGLLHHG